MARVNQLARAASKKLDHLMKVRAATEKPEPLLKFIPKATPGYMEPYHLAEVAELFERAVAGERIRCVVASGPRFAKTELFVHGFAWALKRNPELRFTYGSHSKDIAVEKSTGALAIAKRSGVKIKRHRMASWKTTAGGGVRAVGVAVGLTGFGHHIGVVDDPFKDRLQAESATYRERVWKWFTDVFYTRRDAASSSIFVNLARWHTDDLAGRLVDRGWKYINLPALKDDGESLWPERWSTKELLETKELLGPYSWESLYQGRPRPRGGSVFGDPYGYASLPQASRKTAIGIDVAYSKGKTADYSVIVVVMECEGYFYVLDVVRVQTRPPEFKEMLRQVLARYPTAKVRWYASGTELGTSSFFAERPDPIHVNAIAAKADKFVRAIPYAAAWNAHRVLLPEDSDAHPWVNAFVEEHANFTGVNDAHDDQVDAAVAAHDQIAKPGPTFDVIPERGTRHPDDLESGRRM